MPLPTKTDSKYLNQRARDIVTNVDKYFEEEKKRARFVKSQLTESRIIRGLDGSVTMSANVFSTLMELVEIAMQTKNRVSLATGVNSSTVGRIRKEVRDAEQAKRGIIYVADETENGKAFPESNNEPTEPQIKKQKVTTKSNKKIGQTINIEPSDVVEVKCVEIKNFKGSVIPDRP